MIKIYTVQAGAVVLASPRRVKPRQERRHNPARKTFSRTANPNLGGLDSFSIKLYPNFSIIQIGAIQYNQNSQQSVNSHVEVLTFPIRKDCIIIHSLIRVFISY